MQNGLGFGEAWGKASREIHSAVLAGSTNGYGYADLTAIARNAILQYRDMYLRPDYYAQQEPVVKTLIADLITAVENGSMDYTAAQKEAYTRIYQSINPHYTPTTDIAADHIYLDIPAVDSSIFTIARKLLLENTRSSVTRMDILLTFAKKSVFPVLFAVILYNLFFQLAVQYGTVNYIYLLYAVRDPLWHTVYVPAANVLWQFGDRACNGLFQYRHRRADRRRYPDMEAACCRLVCACYGGSADKGVRRYGEAVFMLRLIFLNGLFQHFMLYY